MRILFSMIYAPDKGGSGAPIYVRHLLKKLSETGEKQGVIYSTHTLNKLPIDKYYHSYPIYFDHPPIFDNQPKVPFSIPFKDMMQKDVEIYINKFYEGFKKILSTEKYDLMHIQHGMYIGYAASLVKRELKIPYVITLHVMEINFLPEFPDPVLAMKAMVDADKIIALTQKQKKRFLETYSEKNIIKLEMEHKKISKDNAKKKYHEICGDAGINPNNIIVCPLGIDTNLFSINRKSKTPTDLNNLGIKDSDKIVMYAGRLIEMKGIRHLLQAEEIYNIRNDTHTIILGGGELEDLVEETAKKRKNVHFLGFKEQDEMPQYHNFTAKKGGVFCVPSRSEGLSLVNLEAMSSGTKVVACCKNDMGDLDFMQKPFVLFAEFGNPSDIANKILKLLSYKDYKREDISKKVEKYNLYNMFDLVYKVYKTVLNIR